MKIITGIAHQTIRNIHTGQTAINLPVAIKTNSIIQYITIIHSTYTKVIAKMTLGAILEQFRQCPLKIKVPLVQMAYCLIN